MATFKVSAIASALEISKPLRDGYPVRKACAVSETLANTGATGWFIAGEIMSSSRTAAFRLDKVLPTPGAGMCGLDRTYIGWIERGERNVALVNVKKIARAFPTYPE